MKLLDDYQRQACRTLNEEGRQFFFQPPASGELSEIETFNRNIDLLHAALGAAGEIGELIDTIKKAMFYGVPLDIANIREEAGDALWYIAGPLCRALDCKLSELATENIAKLKKRYPNKFTTTHATERKDKAEPAEAKLPVLRMSLESEAARMIIERFRSLGYDVAEDGTYWEANASEWLPIRGIWEF